LSVVEDQAMRAAGIQAADKLNQLSWRQAMLELAELVKPYIARYQALEAAAPDSDKPAVHFIVTHEVTVLRFAELAAAGDKHAVQEVLNPARAPVACSAIPAAVGLTR